MEWVLHTLIYFHFFSFCLSDGFWNSLFPFPPPPPRPPSLPPSLPSVADRLGAQQPLPLDLISKWRFASLSQSVPTCSPEPGSLYAAWTLTVRRLLRPFFSFHLFARKRFLTTFTGRLWKNSGKLFRADAPGVAGDSAGRTEREPGGRKGDQCSLKGDVHVSCLSSPRYGTLHQFSVLMCLFFVFL